MNTKTINGDVMNKSNQLPTDINLIEKEIIRLDELSELYKKQKLDLELKNWNGSTPHPDYIQQVKKETIERYGRNLEEIGMKQGLIEVYNHLENYFGIDMEYNNLSELKEWYEEDKEELSKLFEEKKELEKKIKIIHN